MTQRTENPAQSGAGKADIRKDAKGQFVRQKTGTNPDGLHSANPVVTSGNGDATQPLKRPAKSPKK